MAEGTLASAGIAVSASELRQAAGALARLEEVGAGQLAADDMPDFLQVLAGAAK